jgi:hypothetical protein
MRPQSNLWWGYRGSGGVAGGGKWGEVGEVGKARGGKVVGMGEDG